MQDAFYMARQTVLINYTKEFNKNTNELINSEGFSLFLDYCFDNVKIEYPEIYDFFILDMEYDDFKKEMKKFLKLLAVLDLSDINHRFLTNIEYVEDLIEVCYNYWRSLQRYSFINVNSSAGYQSSNFIEADSQFNHVIRNASFVLSKYDWNVPNIYAELTRIPFVKEIMLRTPLIIHPLSNKRNNVFIEVDYNPINDLKGDRHDWICYPAKVGNQLMFCYFHQDFVKSMVALPNLFELASEMECSDRKPDAIMIFGNPENSEDTVYYHDIENSIWVGKVSGIDKHEYFGYVKKMMLTLHNLAVMDKGWLPIHGAMINLYLKDGSKKGIALMGDSGAGKSETIEAMTGVAKGEIIRQEIIFDDMGSFKVNDDGQIVATGTEIGAFVRLDDLDKGTAYKDLDRAIFFSPEASNARVVTPAAPYHVVCKEHKVDMFLYANNYTDARGVREVTTIEEAKPIFTEGKRFALGTTQEKGLSTTYFANPFGPMQHQDVCNPIIDKIFNALFETKIPLGEVYTCLGVPNKGNDGIIESATVLLNKIKEL